MGTSYSATTIDGFGDAVAALVKEHIDETKEEVRKNVQKAGKAGAAELRSVSPKLTGEYAAGWRSKVEEDSLDSSVATVYNSSKPSLTHLLEFGHGLVWMGHPTGRRVGPKPHLDAGYDAGAKILGG